MQFSVEGIQRFLRLVLPLGCDRAEPLTQQQLLILLIKRAEQRRAQITDEGQGLLGGAEPLKAADATAAGGCRITPGELSPAELTGIALGSLVQLACRPPGNRLTLVVRALRALPLSVFVEIGFTFGVP